MKGHNSIKAGVMVLNLCKSPDDALYLYQVSRKYLKGFQSYLEGAVRILKCSKGYNSVNSVGGVIIHCSAVIPRTDRPRKPV